LKLTEVISPTFTLLNEYQINKFKINHYDLFRLESSKEIDNLDLFTDSKNSITLIEWPQKIKKNPKNLIKLEFYYNENYQKRSVEIKRKGLFKDVEVKLNFDEIKSVKLDISEGFNPRRRIALVLKGRKKPLPLSGAGELKPLLQVEEEGARLAKFLNVNLEGLK